MKYFGFCKIAVLLISGVCALRISAAEIRPIAFLHALREQGYGDLAVDYLNQLKESGDWPEPLRTTWDLEMCRCLRVAARDAYNARESQSLLLEAEQHLNKFIREHPDHADHAGDIRNHPAMVSDHLKCAGFSTGRGVPSPTTLVKGFPCVSPRGVHPDFQIVFDLAFCVF
ncbi:MAG: hypothetical protein ACWGMZ_06960 [Thermoguttaceae bacterium]